MIANAYRLSIQEICEFLGDRRGDRSGIRAKKRKPNAGYVLNSAK
jgi:hypothetical protein